MWIPFLGKIMNGHLCPLWNPFPDHGSAQSNVSSRHFWDKMLQIYTYIWWRETTDRERETERDFYIRCICMYIYYIILAYVRSLHVLLDVYIFLLLHAQPSARKRRTAPSQRWAVEKNGPWLWGCTACAPCEAVCFTEILDLYTFMMFLKLKVYMVLFCTISSINTIYDGGIYVHIICFPIPLLSYCSFRLQHIFNVFYINRYSFTYIGHIPATHVATQRCAASWSTARHW
jgi:ferredoxin